MNDSDPNRDLCEAAERGKLPGFALRRLGEDTRQRRPSQPKSCGWFGMDPQGLIISLIFLGFIQGCGSGGPEAVADRFMDAYYAAADLGEALKLADGLAVKKIRDQQQLTGGQSGPQASQGRRVNYHRIEQATVEGKLFFRYEVRIEVPGGGAFTRKSLLAMAQRPNGWRVTKFSETD